jgi:hypothetical protein
MASFASGCYHSPPCATATSASWTAWPFRLGDPGILAQLYQQAGIREVQTQVVSAPQNSFPVSIYFSFYISTMANVLPFAQGNSSPALFASSKVLIHFLASDQARHIVVAKGVTL